MSDCGLSTHLIASDADGKGDLNLSQNLKNSTEKVIVPLLYSKNGKGKCRSVEAFCSSPEEMTQSHENIGQILKQRIRSSRRQQNIICVDRL